MRGVVIRSGRPRWCIVRAHASTSTNTATPAINTRLKYTSINASIKTINIVATTANAGATKGGGRGRSISSCASPGTAY